MAGLDNLNSSPMRRMSSQLRSLNTAPAATNTAIGRAGMEVYDGGVIDITNGGLNVTGTATISGTLTGSGDFDWSGSVNLTGPTDIAGDLDVAGPTTITGTLDVSGAMKTTSTLSVEGVTTLKNDLNVTTGQINVGAMTIDPSAAGGSIQFSGGSFVAESLGNLIVNAANYVMLNSTTRVNGDFLAPSLPTTTNASNLYVDPTTGAFYRCV